MKRRVRIKKLPKAKVGQQVDYSLYNDQASWGGGDYNRNGSEPGLSLSKYITRVPRKDANVEAEGGETVFGDLNGDGIPEHKIIKGPRHSSGGVPLSLPEDTFIFSDTRSMKVKDPKLLKRFGKNEKKAMTPAKIAKQYDINKYRKILEDPNSDDLSRKTAELMIKNYNLKLAELALVQESMKGMPQGIPVAARPALDVLGLNEQELVDPQLKGINVQLEQKVEEQEGGDEEMEEDVEQAEEMNQAPVAQPQAPMTFGGRTLRAQAGMSMRDNAMGEGDFTYKPFSAPDTNNQVMRDQTAYDPATDPNLTKQYMTDRKGNITGQAYVAPGQTYNTRKLNRQFKRGKIPGTSTYDGTYQDGGGITVTQTEVTEEPLSFYDYARGEYDYFLNNPDMWNQDPDMMYSDGSFKFCLDCLNKDYDNPDHLRGIVQLMEEGITEGPHNTEWANELDQFHAGLEKHGIDPPMLQQHMYGGTPMAAYGMMMGGYDMPFYDAPKASVGRAIPKAQNGVEISVDDPDYERKAWQADQDGKRIIRVNSDGTKSIGKYNKGVRPEYDEATMSTDFGATESGKAAAIQYYLLNEGLKDPAIRKKFYEEYKNSVGDVRGYRNSSSQKKYQSQLEGFDEDAVIDNFLRMQKRNLMFKAKQVDPVLFSDSGRGFRGWSDLEKRINDGMQVVNPATGEPITSRSEFEDAKKHIAEEYGRRDQDGNLVNKNNVSIGQIATAMGEPLQLADGKTLDRAVQQAGFHAYANMMNNATSYDPDTQFAIRNFLGERQVGDPDEKGMAGYLGTNVSPIDDFSTLDRDGDGIVEPRELDPSKFYASTYGNTTTGELTGIQGTSIDYGCQCDDPDADFYMEPVDGKCPCEPEDEKPKKCPCKKKDGTIVDVGVDPNTGDCLPCEEPINVLEEDGPAPWWLQDTIKTAGAFGDLMGIKKYMAWAPRVDLEEPDAVYADPTRELAQQAEQANIQTQAISQFAGAQAQSARASSIQGQAAKQAADTLNQYNVNNIAAANANEQQKIGIRNQEQLTNQQIQQNLYDQTTVANQQFDNAKLAARNNLRNLYTNAITNRMKQQNLNALNEQYDIDPSSGGRLIFKGGRDLTGKSSKAPDYIALYKQCRDEGVAEKDLASCAESKVEAAGGSSATPSVNPTPPPGYGGVNAGNAPVAQKGGYMYDDGGFVYASNVFPFIL